MGPRQQARRAAALAGAAGGLTPKEIVRLPAFAGLAPDSAMAEVYVLLGELRRSGLVGTDGPRRPYRLTEAGERALSQRLPADGREGPGVTWTLEELCAWLSQLAEVAAGLRSAADLAALAVALEPAAAAKARDAARAAIDQRDRLLKGVGGG